MLGGLVVDSADSELKLMNFCLNKLNIYTNDSFMEENGKSKIELKIKLFLNIFNLVESTNDRNYYKLLKVKIRRECTSTVVGEKSAAGCVWHFK